MMSDIPAFHGDKEAALVQAARTGDRSAFSKLVSRHHQRVRAYVRGYLGSADVADDVSQDVFASAFFALASFEGSSSFGTWLIGIARHRVLRQLRARASARTANSPEVEALLDEAKIADLQAAPDRLLERERSLQALEDCLAGLQPRASEMVRAHYFEGQSTVDIARRLGRNDGAVRVALLRLRRLLRRCVDHRLAAGGAW
jgi:RNA polymerase sigma-70 factor, ECF subfamily